MRRKFFTAATVLLLLFSPSQGHAQQLSVLSVLCQSDRHANVTIAGLGSGSRYLGVTATLSDGTFYDFPAERASVLSIGRIITVSVPSNLPPAVKFSAAVWGGKRSTNTPWSDLVRNHQGYVMTDIRSETVTCTP